jgi:hypothetical protein
MSCPGESSGILTSNTQVVTKQAVLLAVHCHNGTVTVYDSEDSNTSGKKELVVLTTGNTNTDVFHVDGGISVMKGMYITFSGGGHCVLTFRRGA